MFEACNQGGEGRDRKHMQHISKRKIQCCPQLVLNSVYAKLESVHVNSYEVIRHIATINRGIVSMYKRLDACTLCETAPHPKL
jgi:hypothetical protein